MFHANDYQVETIFVCICDSLPGRFVGDFKMVNILSYWLVDCVDYFKK